MSNRDHLRMTGVSDTGRERDHNEDCIRWDITAGLAVVADGMGGHNAGEVASQMAIDKLFEILIPQLGRSLSIRPNKGLSRHATALHRAINRANASVYQAAQEEAAYAKMGTTVVAALFYANKIVIAHIGDSRCYRFRDGALELLTTDHSFVQEMVDKGASREVIQNSPYRNALTRAVGIRKKNQADINELAVIAGDRFLLCSDGLTGMLDDAEISTLLSSEPAEKQGIITSLVSEANRLGGKDNISVVMVDVD